jgi:phosphate transport system permease protein
VNNAPTFSSAKLWRAKWISRLSYTLCASSAAFIILLLILITGFLAVIGAQALSLDFFTLEPTGKSDDPGGMRHAILGTLVLLAMASAIAIPLGIAVGVYLSEYSDRFGLPGATRFICDVLAGVPSIVVGVLGYELLVVPIGNYNAFAGAAALAFIMVPIVARTTEEMLRLVPNSYREASIALGASKAVTIFKVVIPAATGAVITGIMLAIARVAGETAPLLFTVLGARTLSLISWTDSGPQTFLTDQPAPFPSLTLQIYRYASGPAKAENQLAWAGILVLICLIFVINVMIRFVVARGKK